jgi:hypothetical protein
MGQQKTQWSSKKAIQPIGGGKKEKYPYPSQYGSHASMVDNDATAQLTDEQAVVCMDEGGWYVTLKRRLDNGLADPNRHNNTLARDMKFWGVERVQPQVEPLPVERVGE